MMVEGFSNMIKSTELSYDDFIETYGQIRSNSASSGKQESWGSNDHPTSSGSFSTIAEATQRNSGGTEQDNDMTTNNSKKHEMNVEQKDTTQEEMNELPEQQVSMRRRNSKFSNAASRLARKSFRMVKKKSSVEDMNSEQLKSKPRPGTPIKWNKLFKRNQNVSKQLDEKKSTSIRSPIGDENHVPNMTSQPTSFSRHGPVRLARSSSHNLIITSSTKPSSENRVKSSSLNLHKSEKTKTGNENPTTSNLQDANAEDPRKSHRIIINNPPEPKPCTPEYDIIKKYKDIREEEELRRVAVVTLLKRRKNSLKIKFDQFGKDLLDLNDDDGATKTIRSRIKQVKKKLEIVEQCIEEQTKAIKAHSAKVILQQNLELYQLDLIREENNGYSCCIQQKIRNKDLKKKTQSSSSASCETLQSVEETCVFDDTSSVNSFEQKDNLNSSLSLCDRRSSSTGVCNVPTSKRQTEKCTSIDELRKEGRNSGRSQSIDFAVTSDCDSGFGNGDTLSRSDVSLDRSFSKSTGSITSSSSRGTLPLSASIQGSTSPNEFPRHNHFFSLPNSSSEQHLHKTGNLKKSSMKHDQRKHEVDASVLATIEDFERFAERTKRRLSNKGKLIPLKKGC